MVLKIAITGNIASGKSQVEKLIKEEYNLPVYDTDLMAHEVLDKMSDFYGYNVFTNGKIDRKKLGELVFSDPEAKKQLEFAVHPKVKEEILSIFDKHKNDKLIFISVPLLFEAGFEQIFDKIILITVNEEIQLKRLMIRNNFTKEEALKRINSQINQDEKIQRSDFIITNNSTIDALRLQLQKILEQIQK